MQETLNSKKKGDVAFRHKDLRAAIECYTQVKMIIRHFFLGINCHFELLRIPSRCLQLAILFLAYQNCISVSLGCKQYQIFFVLCELPKTEADEE